MDTEPSTQRASPLAGLMFVVVGVVALVLTLGVRSGSVTSVHDPGPRLIPSALGLLLLLGGCWEVIGSTRRERRSKLERGAAPPESPRGGIGPRAVELVIGLPVYLVTMNWIGFHLATGLMVTLMLWRWGVGWWRGLASGLILVGVVHVLFGIVFRVALPSGFWG